MEAESRFRDDSPAGSGDPTTSHGLNSAQFALFSPGPDRAMNPRYRWDEDLDPAAFPVQGLNRDNIVEIGP